MKKRIVFFSILIALITSVVYFIAGVIIVNYNNYTIAKESVKNYALIIAKNYSDDFVLDVETEKLIRLTVIDNYGNVIYDSKSNIMDTDNHLSRPEIVSALNGTPQFAIRNSTSINKKLIYYALKVDTSDGYVFVRVAYPIESIDGYVLNTLPVMILILVAVVFASLIISNVFVKRTIKPLIGIKESLGNLSEGKHIDRIALTKYSEINDMVVEINQIGTVADKNLLSLKETVKQLDFVLNNISDGIFAVNKDENIELINKTAQEIFDINTDLRNKNLSYLTTDEKVVAAIDDCRLKSVGTIVEWKKKSREYLLSIKNVRISEEEKIVICVLKDITIAKNNEKQRSEFFANASHELKTPLTSIKGFNELVKIKNKDSSLNEYVFQIEKETDRMLSLIKDMLKLSELENKNSEEIETVDLKATAIEVIDSLKILAEEKKINVNLNGEGQVKGTRRDIFELIKNLVENSIKYNNLNGKVDVNIKKKDKRTVLEVADNGIGIDSKHHERIFERFYRVEKSRSRQSGGTGLGLSIVKHVCQNINADLMIKSQVGFGTTVTITFKD